MSSQWENRLENVYHWDDRLIERFHDYGEFTLSALLIVAAIIIIIIALCSKSVILKSIVLAYVILP